jgi:hypothetical protein
MRIPLVAGRWLDEHDDANSAGVIAVNQAFVKRFFGGGDVLGKSLQLMGDSKATRELRVWSKTSATGRWVILSDRRCLYTDGIIEAANAVAQTGNTVIIEPFAEHLPI